MAAMTNLLDRLDDDRLVQLARNGRSDAFTALHDRHRPTVLATARRLLHGTGNDPQDAVQDAFVKLHRRLANPGDDRSLEVRAWLCTVVRNRALDAVRANGRGGRITAGLEDVEHLRPDVDSDPARVAERRAVLRTVVGAVDALPRRQRQALVMRELQGAGHEEIGACMGTTLPATKSLILRARREVALAVAA